jgi:hypothetical protein
VASNEWTSHRGARNSRDPIVQFARDRVAYLFRARGLRPFGRDKFLAFDVGAPAKNVYRRIRQERITSPI